MSQLAQRLAQYVVRDNAIFFVGGHLDDDRQPVPVLQQVADRLAEQVGYTDDNRELSTVAQYFQVMEGRAALIQALKEALDTVKDVSDTYQLLAEAVRPFTKIISTRFDRALEASLEALEKSYWPIIRDEDVPFFDESRIILVKMRGDLGQPDSLVITEDDIEDFFRNLPAVKDVVRAFFATKTLIFLGYDLNEPAFQRFFRQVTYHLSNFRRTAYAIVPQPLSQDKALYWQQQNVEVYHQELHQFLPTLTAAIMKLMPAEAQEPPPDPDNPLAVLAAPPLPNRPYKALDSFGREDVAIFTGRRDASRRLVNRILAHPLTVLYGESGTGKTSLLQAGVGPLLAKERVLLAVCRPEPGRSLADSLREGLKEVGVLTELPSPGQDDFVVLLWRWQRLLDRPIVLAVDQFEQFFVAYSQAERETAVDLLYQLRTNDEIDLRLVVVIREDFLGRLQAITDRLPGLLDVRFRLEALGVEAARAAIEKPAHRFGVNWDSDLVDQLLLELQIETGVPPPQLQIVCARLYDYALREAEQADVSLKRIGKMHLANLGGTTTILGDYIDSVIASLPPAQRETARLLLGAMVSEGRVKQRLSLAELARAAEINETTAASILDELTRRRLVRRYELAGTADNLAYELAHDYLTRRIAQWLRDNYGFWEMQRALALLRQAVPEWKDRQRLPAPGDLRLINNYRGRISFSQEEMAVLYAAAVAYDKEPANWQAQLDQNRGREVLLRLAESGEAFVRRRAVALLADFDDEDVGHALAQAALWDADVAVRQTAAVATARLPNRTAVSKLVAATNDPAVGRAAVEALVLVRDRETAVGRQLPPPLGSYVQRRVWWLRWQRHQQAIFNAAWRGALAGFLGVGLGLGLAITFSGVNRDSLTLRFALQLILISFIVGLVSAFAPGVGAFVHAMSRYLLDENRRWMAWPVASLVTAVFLGLGWLFIGASSLGPVTPIQPMSVGLLIGGVVSAVALAPLPWSWPWRLSLTVVASIAVHVLTDVVGIYFEVASPVLLVWTAVAIGGSFFLAFNRLSR